MESIFSYTDYRVYLKDYFASKKSGNGYFSLKVFADRAGFKARDYNGLMGPCDDGILALLSICLATPF